MTNTDAIQNTAEQAMNSSLMNAVREAMAERSRGQDTRAFQEFSPEEQAALLRRANEILTARNEIARRAQALYEQQIRPKVEKAHQGEFLVVDVDTGDYEMDADELAAMRRAEAKRPDARLYLLRIGHPTAYRLRRARS